MKQIPATDHALVLRTDFSDDAAWESICRAIQEPIGEFGFKAKVDFLSDPEYDHLTVEQLLALIPRGLPELLIFGSRHSFIFIFDQFALSHPEHPILVVDLRTEPGRSFRAIPSALWSIENNLSSGNLDFDDFAEVAGEDFILRDSDASIE